MISQQAQITLGDVIVQTTTNRGWTPEEIAERAVNKLIFVSETAPEPVRIQAQAYREEIRKVVLHYLIEAVRSDRTTISNRLIQAGHPELLDLLRD
jgi:hypothetical protein